jgi:hypothetical protein
MRTHLREMMRSEASRRGFHLDIAQESYDKGVGDDIATARERTKQRRKNE